MRAYRIRGAAGRSVLELADAPIPEPAAGQVRVRMRAAGLNRGELLSARELKEARPVGGECAGEIDKLGAGVGALRPGERVMGRCAGAFAEFALMEAREALPVPPNLSWAEAAAVPLAFMVVHDMLIGQGGLRAGDWLLVTGISSGVGVAALQAGKALGAQVIGTSGSAGKLGKLEALGLDVGLHTRKPDFHDAVMQATGGRGASLAVNTVGGSVFAECLRALAFEGRMAIVGYVDGVLRSEVDLDLLHSKRLCVFGVSNRQRNAEQRAGTVRGFVADLLPAIADGRIRPVIERSYAFAELPAAKAHMESDTHLGKIVLLGAD